MARRPASQQLLLDRAGIAAALEVGRKSIARVRIENFILDLGKTYPMLCRAIRLMLGVCAGQFSHIPSVPVFSESLHPVCAWMPSEVQHTGVLAPNMFYQLHGNMPRYWHSVAEGQPQ